MNAITTTIGMANVGIALDELAALFLLLLTPSTEDREGNEVGVDGDKDGSGDKC